MPQTIFSVEKLKSQIGEFAKGNKYNVTIAPPSFLSTSNIPNTLRLVCETVSLPAKSLASVPHDIYGPPREMPYRETFTESALSFYLDDEFTVKYFFDTWQANIVSPTTNNVNYWDNYTSSITIDRLSNEATDMLNSDSTYKIELLEAYPSAVGEVQLGHAMGSDILKLSVTFKYKRWNLVNNVVTTSGTPFGG